MSFRQARFHLYDDLASAKDERVSEIILEEIAPKSRKEPQWWFHLPP